LLGEQTTFPQRGEELLGGRDNGHDHSSCPRIKSLIRGDA
jgi:hypothetical protein